MDGGVFISYSRTDRAYVDQLAQWLTAQGIPVWFDYEIATGERFARVIERQISGCLAFIVVMSPAALASEWVDREIMFANSRKKMILPLLLEPCDPPILLANLNQEIVTGRQLPTDRFLAQVAQIVGTPALIGSTAPALDTPVAATPTAAGPATWPVASRVDIHRTPTVVGPVKPVNGLATLTMTAMCAAGVAWLVAAGWWTWFMWFDWVSLPILVVGAIVLIRVMVWVSNEDDGEFGITWALWGCLLILAAQIWSAFGSDPPDQRYAVQAAIVYVVALVLVGAHMPTSDRRDKRMERYKRQQEVFEQVRRTRWLGNEGTTTVLDGLADLPSARFIGLGDKHLPLRHAVVCGHQVVLFGFDRWRNGLYTQQGVADFDLRRDGRPDRNAAQCLTQVRERLAQWRHVVPAARAMLVITPDLLPDEVFELRASGDDDVRLATPEMLTSAALDMLLDGAYLIDATTVATVWDRSQEDPVDWTKAT